MKKKKVTKPLVISKRTISIWDKMNDIFNLETSFDENFDIKNLRPERVTNFLSTLTEAFDDSERQFQEELVDESWEYPRYVRFLTKSKDRLYELSNVLLRSIKKDFKLKKKLEF